MRHISERKLTIYLPAKMQMRLITLAQRNKLKNLTRRAKGKQKLPETMGAIVRGVLEEHFEKKRYR